MMCFGACARPLARVATTLAILLGGLAATASAAPLTGTLTVPGDYATLADAITDLNTEGVGSGGVTFDVAAGHTETIGAPLSVTATGTAADPVVFQKSGVGANPLITAYTGGTGTPGSAAQDGIWRLLGSDYVTITSIDLAENPANVANPATMEYGFALYKASATDGCQNVTIQDCTISLNRINNASGSGPSVDGSRGINVTNATAAAATTNLTVTATSGSNSNNRFYGNTIENCNIGVALIGFADVTPFSFADQNNDVGGGSLATGNTIRNFGGGGTSNPAAGVRTLAQYGENISYNTINNNDGAGVNHATTLRGIYNNTAVSASATITNNIITVRSAATTSILTAIENVAGGTAAGNTITISNNTITGCTYATATSGAFTGITNTASAANVAISGNTLSSNATNATSGTTNQIQNTGAATVSLNINSNIINGWTFNASTTGGFNGITTSGTTTAAVSISGNDFQNITHAVGGSSAHVYISYGNATSNTANVNSNTFTNLNVNTTGSVTFITRTGSMTATGVDNCNSNAIVTAFNKGGSGGTVTFYGANASSVNGSSMVNTLNNFSNVTVTGATVIAGWSNTEGASSSNGPTKSITGNTFNAISGGSSSVTGMSVNFGGPTTCTGNTVSNMTGTGAITGIVIGSSNGQGTHSFSSNTVSMLTSSGTGGTVAGMSGGSSSVPTMNIGTNAVSGLSSTGASSTVSGIAVTAGAVVNVTGNTVSGLAGTGATAPLANGISVSSGTTVNLVKNKIYDIQEGGAIGTTASLVNGVLLSGGVTVNVLNNLIGDLRAPASTSVDAIRGISVTSTTASTTYNVHYNTVRLEATSSGANFGTTGIFHAASATATTAALNLRNNVVVNLATPNGTGLAAAYRRSGTALTNYALASNNNALYAGAPGASRLIFFDGTNADQTLAAFKARVSPREVNSVTENPPFLSTTGSSPDFLHIDPAIPTQLESGAQPIAGVTDDYDGDARDGSTPDIGADEGAFILADLAGPAINYVPLGNTTPAVSRAFTGVAITDPSGVDGTAGTRPRVYYKKSGDANTVDDNTNATDGWKYVEANGSTSEFDFTIDYSLLFSGAVAPGDVVQYFVVAQDLAGTPNVGINSGTFAAQPSSVALTAAAFPLTGTIRSYAIVDVPLSGDYTIGAPLFNRVTGRSVTFERTVQTVTREVLEPAPQQPQMAAGKLSSDVFLEDQITWNKVVREFEEVTWVPMENGRPYSGNLYVKKSAEASLPKEARGGVYATITAAVADLNARGVSGPVRFLLADATYPSETFPITVNIVSASLPTATNTVTIKPGPGVTSSVSGASASNAIFKVLNTNYVTIDGSNVVDGTSRDLTLENTSATTPNVVWFGSAGTTPIQYAGLENCLVRNGVTTSSAVVISDGATAGNPGYFSNVEIRNNQIEKAFIGVYANGGTSPQNGSNLSYVDNDVNTSGANAIRLVGLYMQGVNGADVSGNEIGNFNAADGESDTGIWLASGTINATVSGNTVSTLGYTGTSAFGPIGINVTSSVASASVDVVSNTVTNISTNGTTTVRGISSAVSPTGGVTIQRNNVQGITNTNPSTYGAYGIDVSAGNNHTVKNNFVSDVRHNMSGGIAFSTTFGVFGIRVGAGTGHIVDDNSVNLFGSLLGTANSSLLSAALCVVSSASTGCDVRGNILANTLTGGTTSIAHVSVYLPSGATASMNLTENYNAYFSGPSATTQGLAQVGTTAGTGFYLASNFDPGSTTPASNFRAYSSALSAAGTNDDASLASTDAAPYTTTTDLHIPVNIVAVTNNAGIPIAGITDDYDGDLRVATATDIGADETYTLVVDEIGSGSVGQDPDQVSYVPGSSVMLTATAASGWVFTGWSGDASGNDNPLDVTMDNDKNITATFTEVGISVEDGSIVEGDAGTSGLDFVLRLNVASPDSVEVQYATADSTATIANNDYLAASGAVIFAPGDTVAIVQVTVNGDLTNEADEILVLTLSSPENAVIADAEALGTIINDDGVPSLSINDVSVEEGNAGEVDLVFTLTLSNLTSGEVLVLASTEDITATAGTDYVALVADSVVFTPKTLEQQLTVKVIGDLEEELDETFRVLLEVVSGASLADSSGIGTILDDEVPSGIDDEVLPAISFLGSTSPNPIVGHATIRYGLAQSGMVHLRVYDVQGRLVRTLASGPNGAGYRQVEWNGNDDRGNRVENGVYFIRMTAEQATFHQRVVVLR